MFVPVLWLPWKGYRHCHLLRPQSISNTVPVQYIYGNIAEDPRYRIYRTVNS